MGKSLGKSVWAQRATALPSRNDRWPRERSGIFGGYAKTAFQDRGWWR